MCLKAFFNMAKWWDCVACPGLWEEPCLVSSFHGKVGWKRPLEVSLSSISLEAGLLATVDQTSHCCLSLLDTHKDGNYTSSWESLVHWEENYWKLFFWWKIIQMTWASQDAVEAIVLVVSPTAENSGIWQFISFSQSNSSHLCCSSPLMNFLRRISKNHLWYRCLSFNFPFSSGISPTKHGVQTWQKWFENGTWSAVAFSIHVALCDDPACLHRNQSQTNIPAFFLHPVSHLIKMLMSPPNAVSNYQTLFSSQSTRWHGSSGLPKQGTGWSCQGGNSDRNG